MASRIHVVGLGVEAGGRLSAAAESALAGAEVVIGAPRQLDWLRALYPDRPWPSTEDLPKLTELTTLLDSYSDEVAVLASGDPLYYGIGRWLARQYPAGQLEFYSAVSSIQAACARLGLALQDCTVLSLHGRPLASLQRHLHAGRTLIVLTDAESHPEALAQACVDAGLEDSTLWVCESLGTEDEAIHRVEVSAADIGDFAELQVSVLELRGRGGRVPAFPGIDDTALVTDGEPGEGMISKREVRLQILSQLQVGDGQTVWDVGAGCGGVATELALWQPHAQVFAVEQHDERVLCLRANRERFGVANLEVIAGHAPEALADLPEPERIFIGGSNGELETLVATCWQRLAPGGRLVASAVTDASRALLEQGLPLLSDHIDAIQIGVSRGRVDDSEWFYHDKRPVTIFTVIKPEPARD